MTDKIIGRLFTPKEIYGSDNYTVTVEVTNLTDTVLNVTSIDPELIPGEIISAEESATTTELDELEELKRKLVRELDLQVSKAYDSIYNKPNSLDIIFAPITIYIRLISRLISTIDEKGITVRDESKPTWANQALKINEWTDVEKLEVEIINQLKEDSFLKKAYLINKDKLKNCLDKISAAQNSTNQNLNLDTAITIQPKETVSFPFRCVSPYRFSPKFYEIQFTISYKSENLDIQGNYPIRDNIKVHTSNSAITFGSITGAILGFAVKNTLVNSFTWFDKTFWSTLVGSITLAIIFSIGTAKSSDSKKIISIENFAGGLLIGALCALFSNKLIGYLEHLIPQ